MSRPAAPSHPPGDTVEEQVKSTWRVLVESLNGHAAKEMRDAVSSLAGAALALNESVRRNSEDVRRNTLATERLVGLLADLLAKSGGEPPELRPGDLVGPGTRRT